MKKAAFLFSLILCSCQQNSNADTSWIKRKFLAIPYATVSKSQQLDIYLPDSSSGKFPVIVSIHGGAFMFGDKADRQVVPMLEGIKRGYAVVSINYRLSSESLFPAQINDVKAAIRWIRAHADKYQFDADKIAVWGSSAGGNLAALAGTSGGVAELEDLSLGHAQFSSRVQAVVDWFGPINFSRMDAQFTASGKGPATHNLANSPESKLLGQAISEIPLLVAKANPETYISIDDPAFFIEHGTEDNNVPSEQSVNFYSKLVAVFGKKNASIVLLTGAKHGGAAFETKENLDKVFQFLDKTLK